MKRNVLDLELKDLPSRLAVFPLAGTLLLPGGQLPLNIFEPRYLAMVADALASPHRLIGMIQPRDVTDAALPQDAPPLYDIGCAGRIANFEETDDGRYLIILAGKIRFSVRRETESARGYRQCEVDYTAFAHDLHVNDVPYDRRPLLTALEDYFTAKGLVADWDRIESSSNERLITTLSMVCPLAPPEKQNLLEALDVPTRGDMLTAMLQMETHTSPGEKPSYVRH